MQFLVLVVLKHSKTAEKKQHENTEPMAGFTQVKKDVFSLMPLLSCFLSHYEPNYVSNNKIDA